MPDEPGPRFMARVLTYAELREFAEPIKCVGDTDGDGNCPLPGCMHCHPENFRIGQLAEQIWKDRVAEIKEALEEHWLQCANVTGSCMEDVVDTVERGRG